MKINEVTQVRWTMPDPRREWDEVVYEGHPQWKKKLYQRAFRSVDAFEAKLRLGHAENVATMKLFNADDTIEGIDPEKLARVRAQYDKGRVEMPIVVKLGGRNI